MSNSDEVQEQAVEQPQEDTISLVFDRQKQLATIGHGLSNPKFFAKLARVIKPEYFSDPLVSKVWMAAMDIWNNHHRAPIGSEIPQWSGFAEQDSKNKARINDTILLAAKESGFYGLDLLQVEMEDWVKAVLYVKAVKKSAEIYKSKQKGAVDKALKTLESGLASIKSSSFRDGVEIGFRPSSERIIEEKVVRMEQSTRLLSYGIQFLDDTLVAMIPNDLIILGASTGLGKSACAAGISLANSLAGKRVHYFALEAEDNEMERRIKYGMLSKAYYKNNPDPNKPYLGYAMWRMGKAERFIADLEYKMRDEFRAAVRGMNSLYRTSGHFNLENLERHLYEIIDETDLIIIDHLQYIDVDDMDENRGYRDIIMKVRDIVLNYGVPVIVIAHLRKVNGGRGPRRIIPEIEDFHGTSNISKVCTTAIMLGPADQPPSAPFDHLHPTYCQAVKVRLDGSRTRYVGLLEFNSNSQLYEQKYKLGKAVSGGTEWEEMERGKLPRWANVNAIVTKTL